MMRAGWAQPAWNIHGDRGMESSFLIQSASNLPGTCPFSNAPAHFQTRTLPPLPCTTAGGVQGGPACFQGQRRGAAGPQAAPDPCQEAGWREGQAGSMATGQGQRQQGRQERRQEQQASGGQAQGRREAAGGAGAQSGGQAGSKGRRAEEAERVRWLEVSAYMVIAASSL